MPATPEAKPIEEIVKNISSIQEAFKNLPTKEQYDALCKSMLDLSAAQKVAKRKSASHPVFGTEEGFNRAAGSLAKALIACGKVTKDMDNPAAKWWLSRAANLNEEDSGAGAEFLPTLIDPEVQKLVNQYGVTRRYCRVKNNLHGTLALKQRATRVTAGGQSRGDNAITPAGNTYASVSLTPVEVSLIATVEEKLIWDSPVDVVNEQIVDIAEACAEFEDEALWAGDGTAAYLNMTGIKTASGVAGPAAGTGLDTFANPDGVLILKTFAHPSVMKSPNRRLYMHPYTLANLMTMKASTAGLYFFDPTSMTYKLGGDDVELTATMDCPTATSPTLGTGSKTAFGTGDLIAVYGDLMKAVTMGIGRPGELRILLETYAASNEIGIRFTYDAAIALPQPRAVARLVKQGS